MIESTYSKYWFRALNNRMRRILRGKGNGRRPGAASRPSISFNSPSQGSANPITSINTQQQQSGEFSFAQPATATTQSFNQPNISNNLQSSQSASFPPLGNSGSAGFAPSFTPSSTGFNFSGGSGTTTNNPFSTQNNTNSTGQSSGYSGSMFKLPPPTPPTPKEATTQSDPMAEFNRLRPDQKAMITPPNPLDQLEKMTKEQKYTYKENAQKVPEFAAHAPFTWGQGTQELPSANGQPANQQQKPTQQNANLFQAQPTSSLFGQVNPQQGQTTSNIFGTTTTSVNASQSTQPTSNIFGHLKSQQQTQRPASNLFGQSMTQPQSSASNMFGQDSPQSQQPSSNIFGQNSTQSQQPMNNFFGQNPTQSQQPTSSPFGPNVTQTQQPKSNLSGQNAAPTQQPSSNIFGQSATQPQQSNAFVARTEDSMSTSPDNSPQNSAQKQAGPFAFLNTPASSGQSDNAATQGRGSSLFDRITKPLGTSNNSIGEGQNSNQTLPQQKLEATIAQGGGLFDRISKPPSAANFFSGNAKGSTQDTANSVSTTDPYEILNAKPVFSEPPTSPTKSPPRPRPNSKTFLESNRKIATPTFSLPASQDGNPATNNLFGNIKLPSASQSTSTSMQSPNKALAPADTPNRGNNGFSIKNSNSLSSSTAVTKRSGDKDLSLAAGNRAIGMPPPAPADFSEDQKRELVTGYRLKALDVGLQKHIKKSRAFHTESDSVFRFYQEKKQAILDAGGLPLKSIAGNKSKTLNEPQHEEVQGKRAKIGAPSSQTPKPQGQLGAGPSFNGMTSSQPPTGQVKNVKRKADEDWNNDSGQEAADNAKRARGEDQISYPSLPTSLSNSQTSSMFKNILGGKEESPASDTSNPTVNVSDKANLSDAQSPSATMGNSFQLKPSSTSNNPSPFTTSISPSKAAPTTSMLASFKQAKDAPSSPAFGSMTKPSSSATASLFFAKPSSTEPSLQAPFAPMTQISSSTNTSLFSIKPNTTENTSSAVVKVPTFKPPTFGTGAPLNFLSQFGKTAEETAKKEKEKRKAEDFDSDEDDEAEWERKDAEEQRAKKQKLEEALNSEKAKFIPGEGFALGEVDVEKQKEESTKSRRLDSGSSKASGTSIFAQQPTTQGIVSNHSIFGHLSDVDSGAEGSKTGDADDEDDGSEEGTNDDEDKDDGFRGKRAERSSQSNDGNRSEKAAPFASSNPFSTVNSPRSQSPQKPTSEYQFSGRSLFDRISKDESGNAIREDPAADEKKSEKASKPSLFPSTSNILGQASSSSGSTIFGQSSSSTPPFSILGAATQSKPSSNWFSQPSSSTPAANTTESGSPQGDHTWKPDTPIKFGSSSDAPGFKITSPTPSKPSFGGLFGSPSGNAPKETPAKPTSSIFSTTPAESPSVAFGFAFGGPPKTAANTLAPFSGIASNTTSRATSPGATTAGESANDSTADGEDETVEHDQQIDLSSGGQGEEDEDVLFEVKAKALSFDYEKKLWVSRGVGLFRVLKHRETRKTRMLLRSETIGKILLNSALLSAMKYEHASNKSVKVAVAEDNGKLATWMIRVGKDEDAQKLASLLEENKSN